MELTVQNDENVRLRLNHRLCHIARLNSGNLRTFECNLNLNSSDCRALKIIFNDTKLESISWELNIINRLLDFCVGVLVGGHPRSQPQCISANQRAKLSDAPSSVRSQAKFQYSKNIFSLFSLDPIFTRENPIFLMRQIKPKLGRKMFPYFLPNHILWSTGH